MSPFSWLWLGSSRYAGECSVWLSEWLFERRRRRLKYCNNEGRGGGGRGGAWMDRGGETSSSMPFNRHIESDLSLSLSLFISLPHRHASVSIHTVAHSLTSRYSLIHSSSFVLICPQSHHSILHHFSPLSLLPIRLFTRWWYFLFSHTVFISFFSSGLVDDVAAADAAAKTTTGKDQRSIGIKSEKWMTGAPTDSTTGEGTTTEEVTTESIVSKSTMAWSKSLSFSLSILVNPSLYPPHPIPIADLSCVLEKNVCVLEGTEDLCGEEEEGKGRKTLPSHAFFYRRYDSLLFKWTLCNPLIIRL